MTLMVRPLLGIGACGESLTRLGGGGKGMVMIHGGKSLLPMVCINKRLRSHASQVCSAVRSPASQVRCIASNVNGCHLVRGKLSRGG